MTDEMEKINGTGKLGKIDDSPIAGARKKSVI